MFTETNAVRGLLIDVAGVEPACDGLPLWRNLIDAVPSVFLTRDQHQGTVILQSHGQGTRYIVKDSSPLTGLDHTLEQGLRTLGLEPYQVCYVASRFDDIKHVVMEPIGTVLIGSALVEEHIGHAPDFVCPSPTDLLPIITGKGRSGYFSEVMSTFLGNEQLAHSGYVISFTTNARRLEVQVVSGGRFYGPGHPKYRVHQFSHRIWRSKENPDQETLFGSLYEPLIGLAGRIAAPVDGVTRVPPRPDDRRDRFSPIVRRVAKSMNVEDLSMSLSCVQTYPTQKGLDRTARAANVKGKYHATPDVSRKHVVLIDDIWTTGATAIECAGELLEAGATKVTIVTLGVNQFKPAWGLRPSLRCPRLECDGELVFRFRRDGRKVFFGCSNYRRTQCRQGVDFRSGWQSLNSLNTVSSRFIRDDVFRF